MLATVIERKPKASGMVRGGERKRRQHFYTCQDYCISEARRLFGFTRPREDYRELDSHGRERHIEAIVETYNNYGSDWSAPLAKATEAAEPKAAAKTESKDKRGTPAQAIQTIQVDSGHLLGSRKEAKGIGKGRFKPPSCGMPVSQTPGRIQKVDPLMGVPMKYPCPKLGDLLSRSFRGSGYRNPTFYYTGILET